jgi:hypothetical protein
LPRIGVGHSAVSTKHRVPPVLPAREYIALINECTEFVAPLCWMRRKKAKGEERSFSRFRGIRMTARGNQAGGWGGGRRSVGLFRLLNLHREATITLAWLPLTL